jgi:predicted MFS family arabinose efflux permease
MGSTRDKSFWLSAAFWTLVALFGMNLLNYIDRFILAAVLKPVRVDLGMSEWAAGFTVSVFYVGYAVFSPIVGWLGDRMQRRYLLAVGVGVWSLATCGAALCQSFEQLVLARSLLGVGEAAYATLAPTLIADFFPREQRNRALSFFYLAVPFGAAIGYPLGGFIQTHYGWRTAFFVVGLPGLAVALAALALPEPERGATEDVDEQHRHLHSKVNYSWREIFAVLVRNRSFVCNTLGMAMFTFALGGLQGWAPTYFEEVRGMNQEKANDWLGMVLVVSALIGTPLGGVLSDRLAPRLRGAYFWVSGVTMLASVPFLAVTLLATDPVLIFGSMVVGLTLAFMNIGPSNSILTNVSLPNIRAAAVSVNLMAIHFLGDIPSPPLIGLVGGGGHLFWGMAITLPAIALGGVFFCLGAPHLDKDQQAVLNYLRSAPAATPEALADAVS